jgi:serine-type D-Ala-D-Ala carboxypeptidase/endopeptidase (penicillin-binding protein 4)
MLNRVWPQFAGLPLNLAVLSGLLGLFGQWQPIKQGLDLGSVTLAPQWESPWLMQQLANDPQAESIVNRYVSRLSSFGFSPDYQGADFAMGAYPVAQYRPAQRLPAASLTKVATTLAAMEVWGVNHQFETLVGWRGTLSDGVLQGDLIIRGGQDPLFVWEEGIALGNALHQLGLKRVTGDVVVVDRFVMNFQEDPLTSGSLLKQAMDANQWGDAALKQYQTMGANTPKPQIQIDGQVRLGTPDEVNQVSGWLVRHQSLPLAVIIKAMNIYSNNVMAQMLADSVGGAPAVMQAVQTSAGVRPEEISLINGSGLGEENQISPEAVVKMLQAIQGKLVAQNMTIADLFPVAGRDVGTLIDRSLPPHATLKTGSLSVVSALAGAFPTEDKGVIWFAIINYGAGLEEFRYQQDVLLAELEKHWGRAKTVPPELKTTIQFNQEPYRLGDPKRNQKL